MVKYQRRLLLLLLRQLFKVLLLLRINHPTFI